MASTGYTQSDGAAILYRVGSTVDARVWTSGRRNFKITYKPREFKPVSEYLRPQRRFRHLKDKNVEEIQKLQNEEWERILGRDGKNIW